MNKFRFKKELDINEIYSSYQLISDNLDYSPVYYQIKDNISFNKNIILNVIQDLSENNLECLNILKYNSEEDIFYRRVISGYSLTEISNSKKYHFSIEILLRTLIIFCNLFLKNGLNNTKIPYITSDQIIISDKGNLVFQIDINYGLDITSLEKDLMYVSPELLLKNQCDERSLVYSIGVILYRLSVNKNPFHYKDCNNLIEKILDELPTLPSLHNFNLESELEEIILKCLKKDPSERYQSILDFAKEIKSFYDSNYRSNLLEINVSTSFENNIIGQNLSYKDEIVQDSFDSNFKFSTNNFYWLFDITNNWISSKYSNLEDLIYSFNSNTEKVNGIGILDNNYVLFIFDNKLLCVHDISNGELIKDLRFINSLGNLEFRVPKSNNQTLPIIFLNILLKTKLSDLNLKSEFNLSIPDDFTGYATTFISDNTVGIKRSVLNLIEDPLLDIYLYSSYYNEYNIVKLKDFNSISNALSNSSFEVVLLDSTSLNNLGKELISNNENIKFIIFGNDINENLKTDNTIFVRTNNLSEIIDFFKKIFPLNNKRNLSNIFSIMLFQAGKNIKSIFFMKDSRFISCIDNFDYSYIKNLNILELNTITNTFFDYDEYSRTKEAVISLVKDSFKVDNSIKTLDYEDDDDLKNIYLSYKDYNGYTLDKLVNEPNIYSLDLKEKYLDNIIIPEKNDNNAYIFINWLIKDFLFLLLEKNQFESFDLLVSKLPQISKIAMDEQIKDSDGNYIDVPLVIYFENNEVAIMAYGGGDIDEINAIESICNSLVNTPGVNLVSFFYLSNTKYSEASINRYKAITKQNNSSFMSKKISSKGKVNVNDSEFHFVLLTLDENDNISLFLPEI